jgi:hypothetical protein
LEDGMNKHRKIALAAGTAVAGTVAAMVVGLPSANAAAPKPLTVGGAVECPYGTLTASVAITSSTGETESTTTTDHIFHYSLTFSTVSATFLSPQKATAHATCFGPIGDIQVSYNDNIVKLAHPIIGTGWTANISPS